MPNKVTYKICYFQAFVCIGSHKSTFYNVWDAGEGYWKRLDKMATFPSCCNDEVVVDIDTTFFNGKAYAAGVGKCTRSSHFVHHENTNKFFVYSIETNQWTDLQPMKNWRKNPCLVGHMGFIYAIGGDRIGDSYNLSVERYSLSGNQEWEFCTDIKLNTNNACAVSYKEGIVMCDVVDPLFHDTNLDDSFEICINLCAGV